MGEKETGSGMEKLAVIVVSNDETVSQTFKGRTRTEGLNCTSMQV